MTVETKTYHSYQSWPKGWIVITSKYAGKCSYTGIYYPAGTQVMFNSSTKKTMLATKIYKGSTIGVDHLVFKYVENVFHQWMNDNRKRGDSLEYYEKYFGEERIYDKRGAIDQAIQNCLEALEEEGLVWGYLYQMDLECAFEG